MARFLHHSESNVFRKYANILLAFCWVFGLAAGALVFRYAGGNIVSLMPLAARSQLSITGLLGSSLLPFLFSAFAVYVSLPGLLFPVSFCKAFSYTYVSCGTAAAYGSAGWLVRLLLLFTDSCTVVLLLLYWQRCISGTRGFSYIRAGLYFLLLCAVVCVDIYVISPLLQSVLF